MIIIAGSADVDIKKFIERINESTSQLCLKSFADWDTQTVPQGFIYIKVIPEISFQRIKQLNQNISLTEVEHQFDEMNRYFIEKITMPAEFHAIPVLILNGFIDFEKDISQFYNHLFHIKKFFGDYVPLKKNSCCKH